MDDIDPDMVFSSAVVAVCLLGGIILVICLLLGA